MAAATVIEACNLRANELLVVVLHFQNYQVMAHNTQPHFYIRYTSTSDSIFFVIIVWMSRFNFHLIRGISKDYKVALHSAWIWNSVIILSVLTLWGKCDVKEVSKLHSSHYVMVICQSGNDIFLKVQMFSVSDDQIANSQDIWKSFFLRRNVL